MANYYPRSQRARQTALSQRSANRALGDVVALTHPFTALFHHYAPDRVPFLDAPIGGFPRREFRQELEWPRFDASGRMVSGFGVTRYPWRYGDVPGRISRNGQWLLGDPGRLAELSGEETVRDFGLSVLGFLAPGVEEALANVGLADLVVPTIIAKIAQAFPWLSVARYMLLLQILFRMAWKGGGAGGRVVLPNGWVPGPLICNNAGGVFSTSIGNSTHCVTLGGPIDPGADTRFGVIGEWDVSSLTPTRFAHFTRYWTHTPAAPDLPIPAYVTYPTEEPMPLGDPGLTPGQVASLFPHLAPLINAQPEPLPLSTAAVALSPGFREASYAAPDVPLELPEQTTYQFAPPGVLVSPEYTGAVAMSDALLIRGGGTEVTKRLAPFRKPRAGRREVKLRGSVHAVRMLLMAATYGGMFVRSLFQALPPSARSKARRGIRTYQSMLTDVFNHLGEVDWNKAAILAAEGLAKYAVEGRALREINRATRYSAAGQGYGLATSLYHAMGPDVGGPYGGFPSPHGGPFSGRQDPFGVLTEMIKSINARIL